MERVRVAVVGCGNISGQYLTNLTGPLTGAVEVVACSDLVPERSRRRAEEFGVSRVCTTEDILADDAVEVVVNLTEPWNHFGVSMRALEAGKHVWHEKPLAVSRQEGRQLVAKAAEAGLLLGGAPDTFLGTGLQAARRTLDDGAIGRCITAVATFCMKCGGRRYHRRGVGPVYDMGPYYLTALVSLLGPVARVAGAAHTPFATKPDPDEPNGEFEVETPTSVGGVLEFANGCVGVFGINCEVPGYHPRIELLGTEGILVANDPNMFGGPVLLRPGGGEPGEVDLGEGFGHRNRGLGVADLAMALRRGRAMRASCELTFHVLDIMDALHESSAAGRYVDLDSTCARPDPFDPADLPPARS